MANKPAMRPEDWGFPGFLTPDQDAALVTLRGEVQANGLFAKDNMMPDRHLLRFLRARQFDANKALSMMQTDLAWRREFEGRVFKASDFPSLIEFCKNGAMYRAGTDKSGRPVLVMNMVRPPRPRRAHSQGARTRFLIGQVLPEGYQGPQRDCALLGCAVDPNALTARAVAYVHRLTEACGESARSEARRR